MKRLLFAILLTASTLAWAEKAPNPADYTTVVHVQSSHLVDVCRGSSNLVRCGKTQQRLNVVINGKKYELNSKDDSDFVLRTGDYKAKGWEIVPPELSEYHMELDILFPDGTTRKYVVVGESE
jgi:hypothetical protein